MKNFDYFCKHKQAKAIEYECRFTQQSVELPTGAFTHSEQSALAGQSLDGGCGKRGKKAAKGGTGVSKDSKGLLDEMWEERAR